VNVAIIGTGNVGGALGQSLSRAGHDVTFYSRDEQKLADVASAIDAASADSTIHAAQNADVIILAVPYTAVLAVAGELAPTTQGKVVIDTTNPIKPDGSGVATASGESAAEEIAHVMTGAHVVKAFNTVFAGVQADPSARDVQPDALFATDDEDARKTVAQLAESIGFRPVCVGPLAAARELEALAFLNIRMQVLNGGSWDTAIKFVDAPQKALAA
jgi:8-hydroxy-5-deazaflavin:NADPH oxidoreductase